MPLSPSPRRAAGELADRIRSQLQSRSSSSARCAEAVHDLDRAAICTLHAFALRLLSEHPIEAGLPPRLVVLDEISSQLAFEARWQSFVDRLIEDPTGGTALADAAGGRGPRGSSAPRGGAVRRQLGPRRRASRSGLTSGSGTPTRRVAERDRRAGGSARRSAGTARTSCWPASTNWPNGRRNCAAASDDDGRMERLGRSPSFRAGLGRADNWPDVNDIRDRIRALETGAIRYAMTFCRLAWSSFLRSWLASRSRRPKPAGRPANSNTTTCWSWPDRCCATPATAGLCAPPRASATSGCCSTSSRTPIPSR